MNDTQIFGFFSVEMDADGRPKPQQIANAPSDRDMFAYRCFQAGLYDRATVARLWREERAKPREDAP